MGARTKTKLKPAGKSPKENVSPNVKESKRIRRPKLDKRTEDSKGEQQQKASKPDGETDITTMNFTLL